MAKPTPQDKEAQFKVNELFFSITDLRGIILTGNDVFTRVSGYEREEIIAKPHSIIRHPDMPRTVFKLLWDTIQAGKPIVAYVKNMAKDGSYYWVMACVFPLKDRYLSIRFKPTSPVFGLVQEVYKKMLAEEKVSGMEGAAALLMKILGEKGFHSYEEFMRFAMIEEMKAKSEAIKEMYESGQLSRFIFRQRRNQEDNLLGKMSMIYRSCRDVDQIFADNFKKMDNFVALNKRLTEKSVYIMDLAEEIRLLSLNASVESNRMKDAGRTLSAVANEMKDNSQESAAKISEVITHIDNVVKDLTGLIFELAASKVQVEMMTFFTQEILGKLQTSGAKITVTEMQDVKGNVICLIETLDRTSRETLRKLGTLTEHLSELGIRIRQLQGYVRGAELIHVNGIIETAKSQNARGFSVIFNRAVRLVKAAKVELDEFREGVVLIREEANMILGQDREITFLLDKVGVLVRDLNA